MPQFGQASASRAHRRAQAGVAALLPATLLAAVLVAAPFAGTTTHPLAAGRPAAAVFSAPRPPSRVAQGSAAAAAPAAAPGRVPVVVPLPAARTLAVSYVAIALLAAVGLVLAARRLSRRAQRNS